MRLKVLEYLPTHELLCLRDDGTQIRVDPYVSCAVPDETTTALCGSWIDIPDGTQIHRQGAHRILLPEAVTVH